MWGSIFGGTYPGGQLDLEGHRHLVLLPPLENGLWDGREFFPHGGPSPHWLCPRLRSSGSLPVTKNNSLQYHYYYYSLSRWKGWEHLLVNHFRNFYVQLKPCLTLPLDWSRDDEWEKCGEPMESVACVSLSHPHQPPLSQWRNHHQPQGAPETPTTTSLNFLTFIPKGKWDFHFVEMPIS